MILIISQVAALCFQNTLLGLDPSWQLGRETESSTPEKGPEKARLDARTPTKQGNLQWGPRAHSGFTRRQKGTPEIRISFGGSCQGHLTPEVSY